jgi:hypothetical protein
VTHRPLIPCRAAAAFGNPCPVHAVEPHTTISVKPDTEDPEQLTVTVEAHGISPAAVAYALRQTAARLDEKALAMGEQPIPYTLTDRADDVEHPADDEQAKPHPGDQAARRRYAEAFAAGQARADDVADRYATTPTDWVAEVREALAFNARATSHPAVITLRDVLLDTAPRTPRQALDVACILLATHTDELSTAVRQHADDYRAENGVTRSTRGLLTGMASIRRLLDEAARRLDPQAQR